MFEFLARCLFIVTFFSEFYARCRQQSFIVLFDVGLKLMTGCINYLQKLSSVLCIWYMINSALCKLSFSSSLECPENPGCFQEKHICQLWQLKSGFASCVAQREIKKWSQSFRQSVAISEQIAQGLTLDTGLDGGCLFAFCIHRARAI